MTPPPHPLRCETCNNRKGHYDIPFCKYWDKTIPITKYGMDLISHIGCASHSSRPHPAPAFKRCCDSCINVPCKVLNRVPCLAQEKQENVCEETGCTDIENCDEICQHSRLFSPLQMQEAKKDSWEQGYQDGASAVQHDLNLIKDEAARKARNATLDALTHKLIELIIIDGTTEFVKFPRHAISKAIDSLREQQP